MCLVTQSCLTLCSPMDVSPTGSFVHGDSPGKNTGVGCHALLKWIFPTQGSDPGLPHCSLLQFFTIWATRETLIYSYMFLFLNICMYLNGEGNGTPLQHSCLENPMDAGAWWAAVYGVTKSRTWLSDFLSLFTFMHWRRKWQPTPVFLPGESQGWGSLVGCRLWGHTKLDTTEAT